MLAGVRNPQAEILFADESYMAVQSARENMLENNICNNAEFIVTDCLQGVEKSSADLILNNPPFHQQNAVGDAVAWRMFTQSEKVLKKGGELWVIGNRHLGYHIKLNKIFGNCETVASDKKFVILKTVKTQ
jgi:16S rRNA (guanine1207-N2)-methyltransferase